jgi:hypothetical protein
VTPDLTSTYSDPTTIAKSTVFMPEARYGCQQAFTGSI